MTDNTATSEQRALNVDRIINEVLQDFISGKNMKEILLNQIENNKNRLVVERKTTCAMLLIIPLKLQKRMVKGLWEKEILRTD